jgi:hypothetical protein
MDETESKWASPSLSTVTTTYPHMDPTMLNKDQLSPPPQDCTVSSQNAPEINFLCICDPKDLA